MSLKAKVEAIIYAAEEPVTLEQISGLLKEAVLADLASARENAAIERADIAAAEFGEESRESTMLPELESPTEELDGCEPGPLMPTSPELGLSEEEGFEESEAVDADDEPFFAMEAATAAGEAATAVIALEDSASVAAGENTARKRQPKKSEQEIADDKAVRGRLREILAELVADYSSEERGMEIRQVAGGFRMATKPQHHDVVRAFAKSLKPAIRLSLAALETLAVIAYKQPVTAPEIADIRGVESGSVLGTLLDRKLITTSGRKQVIGRPMQYKTSKDFLLRFGLNDVNELPSMEEFSQLASDATIEIAPAETPQTGSLFEDDAPAAGSGALPDVGDDAPAAPQAEAALAEVDLSEAGPADAGRAEADLPEAAQADAAQSAAGQAPATEPREEKAEAGNAPDAGNHFGR